jgi:hypothetical protein
MQKAALDLSFGFVGDFTGVQMQEACDLTIGLALTRLLQGVENAPPESALCNACRRA